ncbi:uncharacterized protein EV422DRAFT_343128 [Fimicolochytrium jonesii]|uniref:uncharacterized protein n=1 Tax=Fimicolochytrium jonesii TaxID=1396493 RepID=UPI0022FE4059|nr:uncharacterized protein EV422DRAFT_343128 [Fimicolochytrium jonesii]KAI8815738.1 hypothetical protein EV422DRAFT_343128 [Fimicolochytrium jonesii]
MKPPIVVEIFRVVPHQHFRTLANTNLLTSTHIHPLNRWQVTAMSLRLAAFAGASHMSKPRNPARPQPCRINPAECLKLLRRHLRSPLLGQELGLLRWGLSRVRASLYMKNPLIVATVGMWQASREFFHALGLSVHTLLLDENSATYEPTLLSLLSRRTENVVLRGDPRQLGPRLETPGGLSQPLAHSLLERVALTNIAPSLWLREQYRLPESVLKLDSCGRFTQTECTKRMKRKRHQANRQRQKERKKGRSSAERKLFVEWVLSTKELKILMSGHHGLLVCGTTIPSVDGTATMDRLRVNVFTGTTDGIHIGD